MNEIITEITRAVLIILFFIIVSFAVFFLKFYIQDFNVHTLVLCIFFHVLGLSLYVYLTKIPVEVLGIK